LSRLANDEVTTLVSKVLDDFPDEKLLAIQERPWFVDITNFKVARVIPKDFDWYQKKKLFKDANQYVWDDPHLFKIGTDNLLRRCVKIVLQKINLFTSQENKFISHTTPNTLSSIQTFNLQFHQF